MTISPSRTPRFMSFGYLPVGAPKYDFKGRLFGVPNLLKRLQAADIMAALDIKATDRVLDFGCGSGYMTVEMAKLAAKATGIDVNPYVTSIKVPESLAGRLEYIQGSGTKLPFPDGSFDRILASEVLPMIPEPGPFLREIARALKADGRLVVVNGLGHPALEEAYAANAPRLAELARRYPERMPASYAEYCAQFQMAAGTARTGFLTEAQIIDVLQQAGFAIESKKYSPRQSAGAWLSWNQFELYLRTGRIVPDIRFLPTFLRFALRSVLDKRDYRGGVILVATRYR